MRSSTAPVDPDQRGSLGSGRERGAVLVEAVIAAPVFFLLVIGLIELAGALRTYSSAESAVRSAGRMASVAGADPMSDRMALTRLAQGAAAGVGSDAIDFIVIWHATGPGDPVPEACVPSLTVTPNITSVGVSDGGVSAVGACNVYIRPGAPGGVFSLVQGTDPDAHFGCQGLTDPEALNKLDCSWPGKNRRVLTTPRDDLGPPVPTDFVGVFIRVEHDYYTGLLGSTLTITDTAIHLIEPQGYAFS